LTKTVDSVVTAYATANKYNMILGTQGNGTVMYGDDAMNLTETILDVLNTAYDAEK
jgi:outer membrane protein